MYDMISMTIPIKSASKSSKYQWLPVEIKSPNYFPISSPYANSGEKTEAMVQNKVMYFIFIQYIFLHTVWFIILVSLLGVSYIFKKYTENYHFLFSYIY